MPAFLVRGVVWACEQGKRLLSWQAELPLNESKLTMLVEENFIAEGASNALTDIFRIQPTPVEQGLKELTESLPENPPDTGVGALERKRFWADISEPMIDAEGLMSLFKARIGEVMPVDFSAEPGAPHQVEDGATMALRLTGQGNVQVRVQQCEPTRVSLATIEGHPLAGMVSFFSEQRGPRLRFTVETIARPANVVDWLAINVAGRWLQDQTWQTVVDNMVEFSGGSAPDGVQHCAETLEGDEAEAVEQWVGELVARRKRERIEKEVAAQS